MMMDGLYIQVCLIRGLKIFIIGCLNGIKFHFMIFTISHFIKLPGVEMIIILMN